MGVRVAFLSATLPTFLGKIIRENLGIENCIVPSLEDPGDQEVLERKRHRVALRDDSLFDVMDEIEQRLHEGTVLVVANHVRSAQEFYNAAEDRFSLDEDEIALLHGSFNARDRNETESRILGVNPPRLLIATQAVEVSLDISYDSGYFELAPIDALIQRMGRVNRSGNAVCPAAITILTKQLSDHQLYDKRLCDETVSAFAELDGEALSESALVDLADKVYAGGYDEKQMKAFLDALHHPDYEGFDERLLAGAHQDWVDEVIDGADKSVEVLPVSLGAEHDSLVSEGLWIAASSLLVPMKVGRLAANRNRLITRTDPWRITLKYDPKTGLNQENIADIESQFI
jgi:CRISPR-associated endonuclease/helicase Cas3